jgi:hypothetical protein
VCLWIAGLAGFRGMVPVEIVQACAGMKGMAWRRCECLSIASLAGLRVAAWQRSCGSEGWGFGRMWSWWGWEVGLRIGDPMACRAVAPWAYGVGLGMLHLLVFQYIMARRSLPRARGSECWCFSSPLCFTSAKGVSSLSAKSLVHRAQEVCSCVPVAISDPPLFS